MKNVTMKSISVALGVSKCTVSRALNDKPGVSETIREKIKQAASEMGYVIRNETSARNGSKNLRIALIISEQAFDDHIFFSQVWKGIEEATAEAKCELKVVRVLLEDEEDEIIPQEILHGLVNGALIIGMFKKQYLNKLKSTGMPCVLIDTNVYSVEFDMVTSTSFDSTYCLTTMLIEAGHARIGFIGNNNYESGHFSYSINQRRAGYLSAMEQAGINPNPELFIKPSTTVKQNYSNILRESIEEKISALEELPTAWVCSSDYIAIILNSVLNKHQLFAPRDFSIVGYDNISLVTEIFPTLTTANVPKVEMGKTGFELLMFRLQNPDEVYCHIQLKAEIVKRSSVAAPSQNRRSLSL